MTDHSFRKEYHNHGVFKVHAMTEIATLASSSLRTRWKDQVIHNPTWNLDMHFLSCFQKHHGAWKKRYASQQDLRMSFYQLKVQLQTRPGLCWSAWTSGLFWRPLWQLPFYPWWSQINEHIWKNTRSRYKTFSHQWMRHLFQHQTHAIHAYIEEEDRMDWWKMHICSLSLLAVWKRCCDRPLGVRCDKYKRSVPCCWGFRCSSTPDRCTNRKALRSFGFKC